MATKLRQISVFFLAVLMSGILLLGMALADDVVNNLDTTIDSAPEATTTTVGSPITVGYYINATSGGGDVSGCNVSTSTPAIFTITPPPGVTVNDSSSASLTFTNCGEVKYVTYKSNTPGTYNINASNYSISGGKPGSKWNVTTAAFKLIVLASSSDNTPPVIVPTISPEPNIWGWNNTDVTVSWSVTDPESGIISMEGCATTTLTEETNGTTLICTATSLGGTASSSVTIKIDKTKPVITATRSPEPNANGWSNTDVTVSFMCTDTGDVQSGIAIDTVTGETVIVSSEGAGQSVTSTGSCIDYAGNEADPVTVSNINIDKTPPEITIITPANGGSYTLNQTVLADWSATDTLSGIDNATGTVPSGEPIDTSSIGTKSFTVTATDLAGNTSTLTVSYNVVYNFVGFGAPLNIDGKKFKKMSTIPVKFQLFDALGNPVSNATATLWVNGSKAVSSGGSNIENYFRYDPTDQQYIFNLSTKQLEIGPNTLVVKLDDGTSHELTITIR